MKKYIALILTALIALSLVGCGQKEYRAAKEYSEEMALTEDIYYSTGSNMAYSDYEAAPMMDAKAATGISLPQGRKWIITMSLSAETDDLNAALSAVSDRINAMNGYVESQSMSNGSTYSSTRRRSASLTIRIPADHVDEFVENVAGLTNLTSSSRYVQDITLAYTDTEGRVKALKTEEARLLELMEQAENMSDLLEIEARLTDVRYELENYASQLRLYDNQVDYATVDLYLSEVTQYTPTEKITFWQRITDGLGDSIVGLGETILDSIAWFIINLPYLITLAILGWIAFRIIRRIRRKRAAKKQK